MDSITTIGKTIDTEMSDELNIKTVVFQDDETLFKIAYWEVPSQNRDNFFRFCLGSTAAIYIFDVSRRHTFERIESWI